MGLIQGLIVAVFILRNEIFKSDFNKYISYFLIFVSIIGLDSLLSPYYYKLPNFFHVFFDLAGDDIPWIMICYLPLYTFFIKASDRRSRFSTKLLYLPFVIFLLLNLVIDLDFDFHLISIPFLVDNRHIVYNLEDYISVLLFLGLHIYIYFEVIRNADNKWIQHLWIYISAIIVLWFFNTLGFLLGNTSASNLLEPIIWLTMSCFVYWLIYTGLFQFNLAKNRTELKRKILNEEEVASGDRIKTKAKISTNYFTHLQSLMESDRIYRNQDLGREDVAEKMSISSGYLTQLIKENTSQSFTSYINEYRVKEVENLLQNKEYDHFDVLSLGLEAGFKSKSAFYNTFKKINGVTPSQFRKKKS